MIESFGDPATEDLFHSRKTRRARSFPPNIVRAALRKLDVIETAHRLQDLRTPPGNRLEALKGILQPPCQRAMADHFSMVRKFRPSGITNGLSLVDLFGDNHAARKPHSHASR